MKKLFILRTTMICVINNKISLHLKKSTLLILIFTSILSYGQKEQSHNKIPAQTILGPAGQPIPATLLEPSELICTVSGVTITTSGTTSALYLTNPGNTSCTPSASFTGVGDWTGFESTGTITYTFSQPIFSARITYFGVNAEDVASIAINASGMQLTNLCGVTAAGNQLSGNFPTSTYGDVSLTVSSTCLFSSITLTNVGGASGWGTGNPCNFIITSAPPVTIVFQNCSKIYLNELCYHATLPQTTTLTVFNTSTNGSTNSVCTFAKINGIPCTAANTTIVPDNPLPFGCFFNPNGTVTIPAGTLPFSTSNSVSYRFRSIADPCVFSQTYRVEFGIVPKVLPINPTIFLHAGSPPIEVYSNGSTNVLNSPPLLSQINTSISGVCGYIPAITGATNISNTVTVTETTTPQNPYYRINAQGAIVFRAPYSSGFLPPSPTTPQAAYTLTYQMCINNTGAATFCANGNVLVYYYFGANKMVQPKNNLESLIVSPNPSSDGIYTLTLDEVIKTATIKVYNLIGQKMYSEIVNDLKEHQLILDNLPKGTYLLSVEVGDDIINKNFIKQ